MARAKNTPRLYVPVSTHATAAKRPARSSPPPLSADVLDRIHANKLSAQAKRAARQSQLQLVQSPPATSTVPPTAHPPSAPTPTRLLVPTQSPPASPEPVSPAGPTDDGPLVPWHISDAPHPSSPAQPLYSTDSTDTLPMHPAPTATPVADAATVSEPPPVGEADETFDSIQFALEQLAPPGRSATGATATVTGSGVDKLDTDAKSDVTVKPGLDLVLQTPHAEAPASASGTDAADVPPHEPRVDPQVAENIEAVASASTSGTYHEPCVDPHSAENVIADDCPCYLCGRPSTPEDMRCTVCISLPQAPENVEVPHGMHMLHQLLLLEQFTKLQMRLIRLRLHRHLELHRQR